VGNFIAGLLAADAPNDKNDAKQATHNSNDTILFSFNFITYLLYIGLNGISVPDTNIILNMQSFFKAQNMVVVVHFSIYSPQLRKTSRNIHAKNV
jgi:hypothetical protein